MQSGANRAMPLVVCAAIAFAGCGGGHPRAAPPVQAGVQVSSGGCTTSETANHARPVSFCVYVLTDGRRFKCSAISTGPTPSVAALEHDKRCTPLRPLTITPAMHAVIAAIAATKRCLSTRGVTASGAPVLPSQGPNVPEGEVIVVNGVHPIFIAYYADAAKAKRLEPAIAHNATRLGGSTERRGAVTILFTHPPASDLRRTVEGCAFG
jgi:hypothetical protein